MLSFLLDKCGAEASELPQLVHLTTLLAEDAQDGTSEVAAAATTATAMTTSAPALAPSTPVLALHAPRAPTPPQTASRDATMLGFLLDRCATAEERPQCPMLQKMRTWINETDEADVSGKDNIVKAAGESNADVTSVNAATAAPAFKPPAASLTTAHSASPAAAALPAPIEIPLPLLPGAGDWRGTITVHTAPPQLSPAYSPTVPHTAAPSPRTSVVDLIPAATQEQRAEHRGKIHNAESPAEGRSPSAHLLHPLHPHPHHPQPSYAGRMPCPASEALAVRNSATVRLLASVGVSGTSPSTRPSSSLPPFSRPTSGFAKRFIADMYDRVSTPRGGSGSAAVPYSKVQRPAAPHAIGSGVRAAREQRQLQQRCTPQRRGLSPGADPWQATTAARATLVTPPQPSHGTLVPPAGRRQSGSEPRHGRSPFLARPPAPPTPSAALPSNVLPGVGGLPRRVASTPVPGAQAGCADPVGLMVVGARIRLPSTASTRSRYS